MATRADKGVTPDRRDHHASATAARRAHRMLAEEKREHSIGPSGPMPAPSIRNIANVRDVPFDEALARGGWDIEFWALRLFGVRLHPGQVEFAERVIARHRASGWRAAYLTICCSAGNRAGKTLILALVILHSTMYKVGTRPSDGSDRDLKRWLASSYEWYHFGIQQEVAELVYLTIMRLLGGYHEAQEDRGCPLVEEVGTAILDGSKKYRGEYLWLRWHPDFGGAEIHFRTTSEKGIGSLGKDMNGVSWDECAFDPNFAFVVDEVLHMRRLSTGGQLVLISTATEGLTAFADKWFEGDPDSPDRLPDSISVRMSTRQNVHYGIDEFMFSRLLAGVPPHLVPQNIDGQFIEGKSNYFGSQSVDEAFIDGLPELVNVKRRHVYVQGVDPALTFDSTWSIVLDATNPERVVGVRASRSRGRQTGPAIAALAEDSHRAYESAWVTTGVDVTGFGGKMFRDLLSISIVPVEFGGTRTKKVQLLADLKSMLETGKLVFPRTGVWLELRRQLLGFRLDKEKSLQTDAVMALAVAVRLLVRLGAGQRGVASLPFDMFGSDGPVTGRVPPGTHILR